MRKPTWSFTSRPAEPSFDWVDLLLHQMLVWIIAALIAISVVFYPSRARGQTYVRPSKGAAVTVFSGLTQAAGATTSSIYEMSAFSALQIQITRTVSNAGCTASFQLLISGATSGTFVSGAQIDPNGARTVNFTIDAQQVAFQFFTVSNLPPYIKLRLTNNSSANCGTMTLVMVPLPFAVRTEVSGSTMDFAGRYPVLMGAYDTDNAGPQTLESALPSTGSLWVADRLSPDTNGAMQTIDAVAAPLLLLETDRARIENVGTGSVICKVGPATVADNVSTGDFDFSLKAASAARAGDGGVIYIPALGANMQVWCVRALAANSDVAYLRY